MANECNFFLVLLCVGLAITLGFSVALQNEKERETGDERMRRVVQRIQKRDREAEIGFLVTDCTTLLLWNTIDPILRPPICAERIRSICEQVLREPFKSQLRYHCTGPEGPEGPEGVCPGTE